MNGNDQPVIGELLIDRCSEFAGDTNARRLWAPNQEEASSSEVDDLIREGNFILEGITEGDWDFDEWPDKTVISGPDGELIALLPSVLIREQSTLDAGFITQARRLLPKMVAELQKLTSQPDTREVLGAPDGQGARVLETLEIAEARDGTVWESSVGKQAQFRECAWWTRASDRSFWVNYLPIESVGPGPYTEVRR